jgi:imidazoleglycerol phosphate synthase cyclase subunit
LIPRLVSRLDVKSEFLIKGVRFEGLRKIGSPEEAAGKYFEEGIDEILLVDNVASLYGRSQLGPLVERVAKSAFVPLTVAGGIKSMSDAESLFTLGADKVAINTSSFTNGALISQIAKEFGAQAVVGSIHAKRNSSGYECLAEQGRERTDVEVMTRISQLIDMGVGEILVTSVDNDGVMGGFDIELAVAAVERSSVPVVIGGGCGDLNDVLELLDKCKPSGIAIASALHFGKLTANTVKSELRELSEVTEKK